LIGVLLASPSIFIGFHLDDHIVRYMFSDLPGAEQLHDAYESPFGVANGEPDSNHWQIERGYAPFWTPPDLLLSLWRPISEATHLLDYTQWPSNAEIMHVHSLIWFFALLCAAAFLYRRVLGKTTIAGLAALLYAFDHNHGFAVGWIANRNIVIATAFGVVALSLFIAARQQASRSLSALSAFLFGCALLSNEASVAVLGYMLGYVIFAERGSILRRLSGLAPQAAVIVVWLFAYNWMGRGASGSGMYIHPLTEPTNFVLAGLQRLPVLVLGQLLLPPAELYALVPPPWPQVMCAFAWLIFLWFIAALLPMVKRDRHARFWAFGSSFALLLVCATYPHGRLLFYVGLGAIALLSQIWHGLVEGASWLPAAALFRKLATPLVASAMGVHLFISPLLLPVMACSVWFLSTPIERAVNQLGTQYARSDRDLVVLTAPEYFYVKLLVPVQALKQRPQPRRLRALGFGAVRTTVERLDDRSLELRYKGGILQTRLMQLYRDARIPMVVGEKIELTGLSIEVTEVTGDGRLSAARFRFDESLDSPRLQFVYWDGDGFAPFTIPPIGQRRELPLATLALGL
jgi:hypothetical protein